MTDAAAGGERALAIAVVQSAPGADTAANLAAMRRDATAAVAAGARLVVFPEYSHYFTPRLGPDWVEAAEPLDGPFATAVAGIATDLGVAVVAGMLERVESGRRFSNTLLAVDGAGERVAVYRKIHLYDAFGARESEYAAPGPIEPPELFAVDGVAVALQTCYDLRFPEVTRRLVDAGAELVLVPSEWVPGPLKIAHWRTLLAARAIENTVFVAAADHAPPGGVGTSVIVDPAGVELAALGDEPGVAVASLAMARLDEVRRVNPALALRRFIVVPRPVA